RSGAPAAAPPSCASGRHRRHDARAARARRSHLATPRAVRYERRALLPRVHHVGVVVRKLEGGPAFWGDLLGLRVSKQATVADQGVRAALLPIGRSEIELLEPVDADGGVAKFHEKRGEGLHHVCFETPDVAAELGAARTQGFPLIDERPRPGLAGTICFLHPKGTRGVLVELATPPPGEHAPAPAAGPLAGLALAEVTARSRDAAG